MTFLARIPHSQWLIMLSSVAGGCKKIDSPRVKHWNEYCTAHKHQSVCIRIPWPQPCTPNKTSECTFLYIFPRTPQHPMWMSLSFVCEVFISHGHVWTAFQPHRQQLFSLMPAEGLAIRCANPKPMLKHCVLQHLWCAWFCEQWSGHLPKNIKKSGLDLRPFFVIRNGNLAHQSWLRTQAVGLNCQIFLCLAQLRQGHVDPPSLACSNT